MSQSAYAKHWAAAHFSGGPPSASTSIKISFAWKQTNVRILLQVVDLINHIQAVITEMNITRGRSRVLRRGGTGGRKRGNFPTNVPEVYTLLQRSKCIQLLWLSVLPLSEFKEKKNVRRKGEALYE